jgi:hypothetical protein
LENIDYWLNWVYLTEFIIKILGLGILNYFRDYWNCFDFILIIVCFGTDTALSHIMKNAKTAKSAKLVKFTKIQKALRGFKCMRSLRSAKFYRCLSENLDSLIRVKNLFTRIYFAIPSSNFPTLHLLTPL